MLLPHPPLQLASITLLLFSFFCLSFSPPRRNLDWSFCPTFPQSLSDHFSLSRSHSSLDWCFSFSLEPSPFSRSQLIPLASSLSRSLFSLSLDPSPSRSLFSISDRVPGRSTEALEVWCLLYLRCTTRFVSFSVSNVQIEQI